MSSKDRLELNSYSNSETPFVQFPENPKPIELNGYKVLDYITPNYMSYRIQALSKNIRMEDFDSIVVNAKGGWFLFQELARLQGFKGNPIETAYHRPHDAYGAIVVKPIPKNIRDSKLLIIEDIFDTGGVLQAMMKDAPNSAAVVAVRKRNIPNQFRDSNTLVAVETENYWLGGCGMDFGNYNYLEDFPRNYPGIVVMPESL